MNFNTKKNVLLNLIHSFRPNSCERLHTSRFLCERNYYEVLNLNKNCSPKEIRESFIRLAKKYHPDTNPDDPRSHARFVELQKAYSVLNTPSKRQEYDLGLAGFPPSYSPSYTNRRRPTEANDDSKYYEYQFNEEYREYFHRSRQYPEPSPPLRVGAVQVTLLLLAFTAVGAVVQYGFLKWLYRRSYNDELEKHQRATASLYALKEEMDKRKEEYDIRKLRLAYFKEVGHGAIGSHLVPSIIRNDLPSHFKQRPFQDSASNAASARDQGQPNNEVKELNNVSR